MDSTTTRSSVRSLNFNLFWSGQACAQIGRALGAIAIPVLAVQLLHATETQVGYLSAAGTAAFLLIGLPAGAWVDRWLKRRTMILADLVRGLTMAAVPILWFTGHLAMWHLYLGALIISVATVFFDIAYQSYIPFLVPKDDIGPANSRLEATSQVANLGGPAIGGLLLKVLSAPVILIADAVGYLLSMVFLMRVKDHESAERTQETDKKHRSLWQEIAEGVRFVAKHRAIRLITLATLIANIGGTMIFTLEPIFLLRELRFSELLFGIILTAGGAGGLLGAAVTSYLAKRFSTATLIASALALAAVTLILVPSAAQVDHKYLAAALVYLGIAGTSAGAVIYNITQVSLRQKLCPTELLGRMNASVRFACWGVMPLSALAAGWLASAWGTVTVLWVATVISFLAVVPLLMVKQQIPVEYR